MKGQPRQKLKGDSRDDANSNQLPLISQQNTAKGRREGRKEPPLGAEGTGRLGTVREDGNWVKTIGREEAWFKP